MKAKKIVDEQKFINPKSPAVIFLLGLLWADGWIYKNAICCQLISSDMIELLKIFNSVGDWNQYLVRKDGKKDQTTLKTYNKTLYNFLEQNDYKVKSKTSPDKILSIIPQELHHYWWRGYFDGDGCLCVSSGPSLFFSSTFEQNWNFAERLCEKLKIDYKIRRITRKQSVHMSFKQKISISSIFVINKRSHCRVLADYIYQSYDDDLLGLSRKYKKYLELKILTENPTSVEIASINAPKIHRLLDLGLKMTEISKILNLTYPQVTNYKRLKYLKLARIGNNEK